MLCVEELIMSRIVRLICDLARLLIEHLVNFDRIHRIETKLDSLKWNKSVDARILIDFCSKVSLSQFLGLSTNKLLSALLICLALEIATTVINITLTPY